MSNFQYYRPNRFPPVVKNLIIINVLVFIAQNVFNAGNVVTDFFALHTIQSEYFKPHQLVTHMFMHGDLTHLFFNMFALWMFGSMLENVWGAKRFLQFYMITGLFAAILHLGVLYVEVQPIVEESKRIFNINEREYFLAFNGVNVATVGASGAVFGCLAGFGLLFPNSLIYIYFLIPVKAKWFVIIYGALELYLGFQNNPGDNVAHFAHVGGAVAGAILVWMWNKTNRKTLY